ncbi:hypothetical protein [Kribbella swartbergensis]
MKSVYRALAGLIAIGVVVQAMAIALAWFTAIKDMDEGAVFDKNSDLNFGHEAHGTIGMMVMPALALLLLIVSFFAKVEGGIKWALFVVGLVALQITLAFVSFGAPVVGTLHGLNAFVLAGVASVAARKAAAPTAVPASETPAEAAR